MLSLGEGEEDGYGWRRLMLRLARRLALRLPLKRGPLLVDTVVAVKRVLGNEMMEDWHDKGEADLVQAVLIGRVSKGEASIN